MNHAEIGNDMMLRKDSKICKNGIEYGSTPMIVPSLSSRLTANYHDLMEIASNIITGPFLISAFDSEYYCDWKFDFPSLIFLDSGGYECYQMLGFEDIGIDRSRVKNWTRPLHQNTIDEWTCEIPTIIISYDHPSEKLNYSEQISRAELLAIKFDEYAHEILIKPSEQELFISIDGIEAIIGNISNFDILGFTEKTLGDSIFDRMINIAKIREIMSDHNVEMPIHILGSLDTLTTPLYFLSGADIFDGLSWLRYIFHENETHYQNSITPRLFGLDTNHFNLFIKTIVNNYDFIINMQDIFLEFINTEDFSLFGNHSGYFKDCYAKLIKHMEGE